MLVLVAAGAGALAFRIPIAIAIATLLAIVVSSYRQTVRAYPAGAGPTSSRKENLGTVPGLVAAAALLADYVLTVAVSVVAGVLAITSAAPALAEHKVVSRRSASWCCSRSPTSAGCKEAGILFAVPTYGFVAMVYVMLGRRLRPMPDGVPAGARGRTCRLEAIGAAQPVPGPAGVLLGCDGAHGGRGDRQRRPGLSASPGEERRHDPRDHGRHDGHDVPRDHRPHGAARRSREPRDRGVPLRALPDRRDGVRPDVLLLPPQGLTAGILILAANTSYQDFPRLSSILARDRFMPSQFRNRGDRLVFSNGIIVLSAGGERPGLRVRRGPHPLDPALRRRRLHRLHPVPDGDGPTLVATEGAGVAAEHDRQRHRCGGHRSGPRHRGRSRSSVVARGSSSRRCR